MSKVIQIIHVPRSDSTPELLIALTDAGELFMSHDFSVSWEPMESPCPKPWNPMDAVPATPRRGGGGAHGSA